MGKSNMEQDILKVLMSEEQLQKRVREMGDELYDIIEHPKANNNTLIFIFISIKVSYLVNQP